VRPEKVLSTSLTTNLGHALTGAASSQPLSSSMGSKKPATLGSSGTVKRPTTAVGGAKK
jgi:hypothetical protein